MNKTKIEWCRNDDGTPGYTWNPVTGCLHGCTYCYARRIAERFAAKVRIDDCTQPGNGLHEVRYPHPGQVFAYGFEPTLYSYRLSEPRRLRKPSRIFVSSMGDLFGEWVPDEWIEAVLRTVRECPQHTFIFLTKNPKGYQGHEYPPNAWLGVTCENQQAANERIPHLLATPAAVRFVSLEPLLGPMELFGPWHDWLAGWTTEAQHDPRCDGSCRYCPIAAQVQTDKLDWVIIGAQTGPGAKLPDPVWANSIINQCRDASVPLFLKDNLNWPERIQEWPKVALPC